MLVRRNGESLRPTCAQHLELSLRSIADAVKLDHRRIETLGFAGAIRGARLGAPPQESTEYLDGWDAAVSFVAERLFGEGSAEVKALETLPPSRALPR
jgi:hypothetical protein